MRAAMLHPRKNDGISLRQEQDEGGTVVSTLIYAMAGIALGFLLPPFF
jgi:hypothetical protein